MVGDDRVSVPLREYLEAKLDAIQEQISRTARDLERRLNDMNEFRAQIQNERAEYVRRETLDMLVKSLSDRLGNIERRLSYIVGGAMTVAVASSILLWFLGRMLRS